MTPEHKIMNEIRLWCGQHDILCFRCNVGKVRMTDGGWFDTGLPEGFPDLLILNNNGETYYVEVKTPTGKQRPDQINFMNEIRRRGHKYLIARSVNDIMFIGGNDNGR